MDVLEGHSFGADPKAYLEECTPSDPHFLIKLVEEVLALSGVKFHVALKPAAH